MKFKKVIIFFGIGSIMVLPISMVSCGTSTLGVKGNSDDWNYRSGNINNDYSGGMAKTANYSVKIVEWWNGSESHSWLPGYNAHFENIIWGLSKDTTKSLWVNNSKASSNFANFATNGSTDGFKNSITGNIPYLYKYSFDITNVSQDNSYLSLATRFSPSPDWFGGVGVKLFDKEWNSKYFNRMMVYSAGVKDERFHIIIPNQQMNNNKDKDNFKPFGFITITKK